MNAQDSNTLVSVATDRNGVRTDTIKIVTNNQYRDLKCFHDIPVKDQADFDYVKDYDRDTFHFFKYRGSWYDTHEFEYSWYLGKWTSAQCESCFSAVYIKYSDDFQRVKVGFAHW